MKTFFTTLITILAFSIMTYADIKEENNYQNQVLGFSTFIALLFILTAMYHKNVINLLKNKTALWKTLTSQKNK